MPPPNETYLVVFQCGFIRIMNNPAVGCVNQHPVLEMRPLMLRIRMKKDAILDAGDDCPLVPHIDSDHVSNMNGLAVVIAHSMTSNGEV
jgi:hypothetical protein